MHIHFIGIGGIGVSALAKYYLAKGYEVSGCDLVASEITEQLKKMGVKIRIGAPDPTCSAGSEKIVYSPAVPMTHPEIRSTKSEIRNKYKIQNTKYKILSYPEALGELTKTHYTIAVSGTHGKSTTTSMVGLLLAKAGLNPTVIVGTKLKEFNNSNCRVGGYPNTKYKIQDTKYLVIEADEHFASFLNYWPKIIALTTIEADHLDYWKTLKNLLRGFQRYITHIPQDGVLVANKDDKNISKILNPKHEIRNPKQIQNTKYKIQKYSLKQPEAKKLRKMLKIPGEHNVSNALAALAVARVLKIPDAISYGALSQYKGSWRRFETFELKTKNYKPYTLVSDYGHHPTEVKVTVEAAREKWPASSAGKPGRKIWLVFQPHQYQRTYYLWKDFVKVLSTLPIEKLIIADIYDVAGREDKSIKEKVSSEKLIKAIQATRLRQGFGEQASYKIQDTVFYIPTIQQVEHYLQRNLHGGEIVMIMGAGDIYNLTLRLTQGKPLP